MPISAVFPTKLFEITPEILFMGFGAQYAGGLAANTQWFDAQSPNLQSALKTAAAAYSQAYTDELQQTVSDQIKMMEAAGATISYPSDTMRAAWASGMRNVAQEWASSLTTIGPEVVGDYMSALKDRGEKPLRDWDQN